MYMNPMRNWKLIADVYENFLVTLETNRDMSTLAHPSRTFYE